MLTRYRQNLRVEANKIFSYNTHVATIKGGQLVKHGCWGMTTSKHINYVAKEYGLEVVEGEKEQEKGSQLELVGKVSAMAGVLCKTPKEKNDFRKRMLSTVNGISFPDDFDTLPEEERTRRLDNALKEIS